MIAGRSRAVLLLGVVTLAAPLVVILSAQAAERPPVWIPIGPGADFTLLSKATTDDPVQIQMSGPSEIEFAHVTISPNGTTGLAVRHGTVVVTVNQGVATALSVEAGACASRTVGAGSAFVQPAGSVGEIRNQGSDTLELYASSLTPLTASAAQPRGPCEVTTPRGLTATVLNHSVIDAPLTAESKGSSDVYVGLVRVAPGATAGGWHVHQGPVVVGVDQGDVTVKVAHEGRCDATVFPEKTGVLEMPQMVHEARNDTKASASFYILGFAPSPQPLLAPAPPPKECEKP
jgi:uncharacterized RmlC-like cupin family protein